MGKYENSIPLIVDIIKKRINDVASTDIVGYVDQIEQLRNVIYKTAVLGESNSVLMIGPRGTGKSTVLKSVIKQLLAGKNMSDTLMQVHLQGLLQTDDRIALQEITRQLHLENAVGNKVFGSFSENLQFLLDSLKTGNQTSKPVVFVLDEFDLFAQHKNQTLLYNLFDISQSAQTPICVIGLTCRIDVMELLEKRVKSRFSHRQIHLFNNLSFKEYVDLFKKYLTLDQQDIGIKTVVITWNDHIVKLCKQVAVLDVLQKQFSSNKDIKAMLQLMVIPVSRLSENHPYITAIDIVDALRHQSVNCKVEVLHGISVLELCLVIAMNHLNNTYGGEPFNFLMVYNEYRKFAEKMYSMQMFDRAVVSKAFEHLLQLEFIKPLDSFALKTQKEFRLMTLLIDKSQMKEVLQKYTNCPTEIKQWAQHTILT